MTLCYEGIFYELIIFNSEVHNFDKNNNTDQGTAVYVKLFYRPQEYRDESRLHVHSVILDRLSVIHD